MTIKKIKLDYNIVKHHLTKPKQIKVKKVKIDFTTKAVDLRKNYIVPNKQSYKLSKQDNDKRLDNDMHAVFKMNDLLNTQSFYLRDCIYRCGLVSFSGEYFCRFFGFDGIFIKTKLVDDLIPTQFCFELYEDNAVISLPSNTIESPLHSLDYLTNSSNYVFQTLLILSVFKQYQNCSNVLNYKSHTYLDEYLCLLHIINTSLQLYSEDKNLAYNNFIEANSITFNCASIISKVLINYYKLYVKNVETKNKENFSLALNELIYKFCINKNDSNFYSLNDLLHEDNKLTRQYSIHFNKRANARTIINSVSNFNSNLFEEEYNSSKNLIQKCLKLYFEDYIKSVFDFLPEPYCSLLKKILSNNGLINAPIICKCITSYYNGSSKLYNSLLKTYLLKTTNNKLNIKYLLNKIKNAK